MKFPALTDEQVQAKDLFNNHNALLALDLLANLPYVGMSEEITAGASEATVNKYVLIAPTKGEVLDAKFITTTVQTGTGNTPTISLVNGSDVVATKADLALGGSIGDVTALTIDAEKKTFEAGDKLVLSVINPAGTITVALKGKLQLIWRAVK